MRHYFQTQTGVRRFTLWVNAGNQNAIQKYRHYGYAARRVWWTSVLANEMIPLMKSVTEILKEIRPEFDFSASNDFIADGMLDSFDMVTLVAALDKNYGISIPGHGHRAGKFPESANHRGAPAQERGQAMNLISVANASPASLVVVPANERSFVEEMKNFNFPKRARSSSRK